MWGLTDLSRRALGGGWQVYHAIMILCGILYLASLLIDPGALLNPRGLTGLLSPSMRALTRLGMTGAAALRQGQWWTLFTALYLHGGLLHFLFNMLWLRQLGSMVQELCRGTLFFVIFTASGVIGMLASSLVGIGFTIGASGAILGLMGALVSYGRRRGGLLGTLMYRNLLLWALLVLIMGMMTPGVNNVAHVSGFATGFLLSWLLHGQRGPRSSLLLRVLGTGLLVLTFLSFVLMLLR